MNYRSQILDRVPTPIRGALRSCRRFVLSLARTIRDNDVICHRGIRLAIDPSMGEGPVRALREGQYEGGELAAIERYIKKTDVVLEMGTGIGFITLFCAKIVGDSNVHSFEANPQLQPLIQRNFDLNDLHPNLTFAVLGDADGEVEFNVEPEYWSSSRLHRSNQSTRVTVPQLSVNEVLREIRPTMLVMDIEGGECDLVPRMELSGVERVMIELHPYVTGVEQAGEVVKRFRESGFVQRWSCPDGMHLLLERDEHPG